MLNPAIVVVAYNRPNSLVRLLDSIKRSNYESYTDITLIISIDGGGPEEVASISKEFHWPNGEKKIITHNKNLGLRNHIIKCGDLSEKYGSIIMLEDDLVVSPLYYDFASKALEFYYNDDRIAQISLYSYRINENAFLPFLPLFDGSDNFFMQVPSSCGQAWTKDQWLNFRKYYNTNPKITEADRLPENVKTWPDSSWKKYFYKYLVENNFFVVYPFESYTTNMGEVGTHYPNRVRFFQVPLKNQNYSSTYQWNSFKKSNIAYDAYFELLPECIKRFGIKPHIDYELDLYGTKQLELIKSKYLFSIKHCCSSIESYDISMLPIENNLIFNIKGTSLYFSKKENFAHKITSNTKYNIANNYQPIGYSLGSSCAAETIQSSKDFRLGKLILTPLRTAKYFIKNL